MGGCDLVLFGDSPSGLSSSKAPGCELPVELSMGHIGIPNPDDAHVPHCQDVKRAPINSIIRNTFLPFLRLAFCSPFSFYGSSYHLFLPFGLLGSGLNACCWQVILLWILTVILLCNRFLGLTPLTVTEKHLYFSSVLHSGSDPPRPSAKQEISNVLGFLNGESL